MKLFKDKQLFQNIVFLFFNLILFSSCNKEIIITNSESKRFISEKELKTFYENLNIQERIDFELNDDISISHIPEWSQMSKEIVNDSTIYSIVPLSPVGFKNGKIMSVNFSEHQEFILFENDTKIYFGRFKYRKDSNGKVIDSKFLNNGDLTLDNLLDGNSSFYSYSNGLGKVNQLTWRLSNTLKGDKNSSNKIMADGEDCIRYEPVITCDWVAICPETGVIDFKTSPLGTCERPYDIRCGTSWVTWSQRTPIIQQQCVEYQDPIPPTGGGSVGVPIEISLDFLKTENLDENQKAKVLETFNELKKYCVISKLMKSLQGKSVSIKILNELGTYNPENKSISVSDLAIDHHEVYIHELFHAYQHQVLYGDSFKNYGRVDSGGIIIYKPGYINVEFEQIVYNDILRTIIGGKIAAIWDDKTGKDSDEFKADRDAYTEWITKISNRFNDFGDSKSLDVSSIVDFEQDFKTHMAAFKKHSSKSYAKSEIINSLRPSALYSLFDTSNLCLKSK